MYLKKIEMHGFKSFADRSVIEFKPGITGIVGPNGCGKSNINDAIRWVLGEQSAKSLRGSNMADVIFNGSENRKPQNLAEVTLVFDNSDHYIETEYQEIEITRRLYRDGNEAEYLMNRTPCRLKDIVDLMMDTGLGRDSLSIISQGNISSFADAKPEERRSIFEEAAGVAKYKKRKDEALRKLERTTDNLCIHPSRHLPLYGLSPEHRRSRAGQPHCDEVSRPAPQRAQQAVSEIRPLPMGKN